MALSKNTLIKLSIHAVEYVRGKVHTNGMENFWSLVDRTINGTYVSAEPSHLFRYLDEQSFRFNNRGTRKMPVNDGDRFKMVVAGTIGNRLTYKKLTGKLHAKARVTVLVVAVCHGGSGRSLSPLFLFGFLPFLFGEFCLEFIMRDGQQSAHESVESLEFRCRVRFGLHGVMIPPMWRI